MDSKQTTPTPTKPRRQSITLWLYQTDIDRLAQWQAADKVKSKADVLETILEREARRRARQNAPAAPSSGG